MQKGEYKHDSELNRQCRCHSQYSKTPAMSISRQEKTSWRSYGGLQSQEDVNEEAGIIANELKKLALQAEFPIEIPPVALVNGDQKAEHNVFAAQV